MPSEQFEKIMLQCAEILQRNGLAQPSGVAIQVHTVRTVALPYISLVMLCSQDIG